MSNTPHLVVMLTHHDRTVSNAPAIYASAWDSPADYWGFKEVGLPLEQMKALYSEMKAHGKTTVLEVVAYTEEECLQGAQIAAACGCDILMGTMFFDSVNNFCRENHLKYMPFVGTITGRPSVLEGTIDEMIRQANAYLQKGVYGIDLLAYRYTGNVSELIRRFTRSVDAPVCLAGSIDSFSRLDEVRAAGAWAFTIGGAFFEEKFGSDFRSQIESVCTHMSAEPAAV